MVKIIFTDISDYKLNSVDLSSVCENRRFYIESINDEKRKIQSLLVWKLLEYSVKKYFCLNSFSSTLNNNKWLDSDNKIKFSLTHSNNIVAVAISDSFDVGVDVEMFSERILKLKSYFNENLDDNVELLTLKWTEKESLYKANIKGTFSSKVIEDKYGNGYYLTCCSSDTNVTFSQVNLLEIL